ncbi:MAG: hypothetical protein GWN99_15660 [Gemmatimonadetes bacterium]|uniref:Uncharacterized protein n=1 Tax=Candidatus Kutchimonas denitrificans TaxID=3056748 RepID=A0AAE4Z7Y6_9BACT|nr:hypothetical protein [Gemmatimonadota bacterium]NIR73836.1 hypothetical protein [Candidatus Kutchimonas denitrificans]NIS02481.1 hypothetical protein [Gemmatimonadota bacterium]NIT68349.1 hypothetical protein [Gemmatimonadota bacterium]NIU51616.1 hypothetical protein [Gemmatimonadota bacterium]
MSVIQIMVTIIIVTILVTVILGVASYAAYWLRRGRRPAPPVEDDDRPRFFYRYIPELEGSAGAPDPSDAEAGFTGADSEEPALTGGERTNGRSGA